MFAPATSKFGARFASAVAGQSDKYKIVVVGGGSGGLNVANQIYNKFKVEGKALNHGDIAVVDGAQYHYYQPGWTLSGAGLRPKTENRRVLADLIPPQLSLIPENVSTFVPKSNVITTSAGRTIGYETLIVATGIQTNWDDIKGLSSALKDRTSGVSSIYSYDTCENTWSDIEALKGGKAVFTQPAGVIKCAGAPQKIMWMAWDRFRRTERKIDVDFYTGMPTMFSVKKYSDALNALREQRGVGGHFEHNLITVDAGNKKATFKTGESTVDVSYDMLHVSPPMGPLDVLKKSPIVDAAGWVDVDNATLRHKNPEFANIWALGDCSSLPTSKTAAAIISQTPVLVENLYSVLTTGEIGKAAYNGYTSCPLLTGYGQLMLAEFKYGLIPEETFGFLDQSKPNRFFYHLKKDLFPAAYWNYMVKGQWFGNRAVFAPTYN